jgi:Domain of Unknown Function (DUF748)
MTWRSMDVARRGVGRAGHFVRRRWKWFAVPLAVLLVALVAVDRFLDEPLRRVMERRLNDRLTGYSVSLGGLDFHVIGLSLDLLELVVVQQAHPEPPVARIAKLSASVQWRELVTGHVVADFLVDRPVVHLSLGHFKMEARDEVPVEKRGWQDALQAIYPFKINLFRVSDADLMYIEEGAARPLHLSRVQFRAENIRNIRSRERTYPSNLRLEAVVFDTGKLVLDGRADFLAKPHPGIRSSVTLDRVALDYFRPIAARYNLWIRQGTLTASGDLEYAPSIQLVHLRELTLLGLHADYVHTKRTAASEKEVRARVAEAAEQATNAPGLSLRVDRAWASGAMVGFVNKAASPEYRVFIGDAELALENLSNHLAEGTATAVLTGKFFGSGATTVRAAFRPETSGPDFDIDVRIDNTDMRAMNDLLRAYGKFDVVGGVFSFYSQLRVKNGQIDGYVKPLFRDMNVYDARQDREKSLFRKVYEGLVGGLARLLENRPRDEVATKTTVAGRVGDPKTSTWEAIIRLIQNAFSQAILPGFDRELERLSHDGARRRRTKSACRPGDNVVSVGPRHAACTSGRWARSSAGRAVESSPIEERRRAMVKVAVPSSRAGSREDLHERARRWSDARVTFERIVDVTSHCPRCEALLVRRMGPGVVCSTCGRLWLVRELLEREATLTSREEQ